MASKPAAGAGRAAARRKIPGEEYLTRREGSKDWQIDITVRGDRVRRSSGTEDKALAAAAALLEYDALYRRVVLGEAPAQHMTLNQAFIAFYREVGQGTAYGEQAQKHQQATMLEILGPATRLADLDDGMVNDLVQALRRREIIPHNAPEDAPSRLAPRTFSPATINRYLMTLSAVCRRAREIWGVEVGNWKLSKHRQEEPEGREVFLEPEQAQRLVAAVIPHARPMLMFTLMTGLRKENVHGLEWERVSIDMARALLIQKGGKPLHVTLVPEAVALLEAVQPDPSLRTGRVWRFGNPCVPCTCSACLSPAKRGLGIDSTRRAFATATKAAGLGDLPMGRLRFHDLRHTFASWLAAKADLKMVQQALGHADITTTARYTHHTADRRQEAFGSALAGFLAPAAAPVVPALDGRKKA